MNQNNKGYVVVAEDGVTVKKKHNTTDLAQMAANTVSIVGEEMIPGNEEDAVAAVNGNVDDEPEVKWKYMYVMLFVFCSISDGFLFGYNGAISAIFLEKGVPSEKRSVLSAIVSMYVVRMFVASITDKYYIPWIGKRKTYILPGKLIIGLIYFLASFKIESWVKSENVWMIALMYLCIGAVQLLEANAMIGIRLDVFGRREAGSAASSATLGFFLGLSLGLQIFTALNSEYMCEKLFGSNKAILSHQGMLRIVALLCLASFLVLMFIREKPAAKVLLKNVNTVLVMKAMYRVPVLRSALIWNFFGPTMAFAMKLAASQYYIKQGIKREDLIIFVSLITIPAQIISSLVWIKVVKRGRLLSLLWIVVLNTAFIEILNGLNCFFIDIKKDNYNLKMAIICLISCLEVFANWNMVQQSFFIGSSPKEFTLMYMSTINSSMIGIRIVPIFAMLAFIDYIPLPYFFGFCLIAQLLFNFFTINQVKYIDTADPPRLGQDFLQMLDLLTVTKPSQEIESPLIKVAPL
jgi:Acetyl-coenzyme A transporter 1